MEKKLTKDSFLHSSNMDLRETRNIVCYQCGFLPFLISPALSIISQPSTGKKGWRLPFHLLSIHLSFCYFFFPSVVVIVFSSPARVDELTLHLLTEARHYRASDALARQMSAAGRQQTQNERELLLLLLFSLFVLTEMCADERRLQRLRVSSSDRVPSALSAISSPSTTLEKHPPSLSLFSATTSFFPLPFNINRNQCALCTHKTCFKRLPTSSPNHINTEICTTTIPTYLDVYRNLCAINSMCVFGYLLHVGR